jgi:hypothetical protein
MTIIINKYDWQDIYKHTYKRARSRAGTEIVSIMIHVSQVFKVAYTQTSLQ